MSATVLAKVSKGQPRHGWPSEDAKSNKGGIAPIGVKGGGVIITG